MTTPTSERPPLALEDLPDVMSLQEAAEAVRMTTATLRRAIHAGELEAYIPRDRPPLRAGRGQGYRIHRDALQRWYFGPTPVS